MSPGSELERVYDAHAAALFAFALNLTRNEGDARDLLQDVFVKLARQPELLRSARDERAFLLRLVHNAAIDLFRRGRTRSVVREAMAETPSCPFASTEDPDEQAFRAALADALGELPPDQRAVVHLKLWEGLTFETIAGLLQIPLNTAASRYRYGVDKLRDRLRPLYEELR
jgi:RNA polymerase sigma-70 factor (ECF subfamily)